MEIIRESDLDLFKDHIEEIQDEVKKKTWIELEPSGDAKMTIVNKVIEYVKKNKRKIYGSYSHNKNVIIKNKKDAFLSDLEIPDIDFYSPDPLHDLYEICNMFNELGYKSVVGREAQHEETYKIYVDDVEACDISYVPRHVYNKIPFVEIDGSIYVHPHWALIDYLRILTDPLTSWEQKLDKRFKRFYLLQKYYPFPDKYLERNINIEEPIDKNINFDDIERKEIINVINKIFRLLIDKDSILMTGLYAYNYYLHESQYMKKDKKYNYIDIQSHEIISTNYIHDTKEIINKMTKEYGLDFTYEEYYPFFQFTDFSTRLYYKKKLICIIYGSNHKCLPYKKVKTIYFEKNMQKENSGYVKIPSFNLLLLHSLYNYMIYRSNEDNNRLIYMKIICSLIKFRNYYLEQNKKNIFDNTLFSDFVIDCIGKTISAKKEQSDRIKANLDKGKPAMFQYRPDNGIKNDAHDFQFKNSSGNKINNPKNNKIILN